MIYSLTYKNAPLITSLVFPIFFIINFKNGDTNPYFLYFFLTTTNASIVSILFWSDPIQNKNQLVHKLDAISARYVIISYALYKLFINQKSIYLFFTSYFLMLFFFYLSNKFSSRKWCCRKHIECHINAHLYSIPCFLIVLNDLLSIKESSFPLKSLGL